MKVGISVSGRIGGAVVRNRLKRRIREIVRMNFSLFPPEGHFLIGARKGAAEADFESLKREILTLTGKLKKHDKAAARL